MLGILLVVPFALWELRHEDPLIDVRMFRSPALGPVFLTAGLFGVSVLGAQAPLSTFARTDPDVYGYGLGTPGFATSLIIGIYLIAMIVGALLFPLIARLTAPRLTLMGASTLVGIGFLLFLPFHDTYGQVIVNMVIVGLGIGSAGRRAAGGRGIRCSCHPDGRRDRPDQLGQDGRRRDRVVRVRHRAAARRDRAPAAEGTAGSLSGYFTVWIVCGVTALVAAAPWRSCRRRRSRCRGRRRRDGAGGPQSRCRDSGRTVTPVRRRSSCRV